MKVFSQPCWGTDTCANDSTRRFWRNNLKIAFLAEKRFSRARSRMETMHVSIVGVLVDLDAGGVPAFALLL